MLRSDIGTPPDRVFDSAQHLLFHLLSMSKRLANTSTPFVAPDECTVGSQATQDDNETEEATSQRRGR